MEGLSSSCVFTHFRAFIIYLTLPYILRIHFSQNTHTYFSCIFKHHVSQSIHIQDPCPTKYLHIIPIHITNTIFHKIYIFLIISTHQTLFQELITKSPSYKRCKVEFIQSFFWLYSMPNLLVIQHLEILYLGENHVRVVCKRAWRKVQECTLKKSLTIGSCDWRVTKCGTRVKHAGELKGHVSCSTTGQNF